MRIVYDQERQEEYCGGRYIYGFSCAVLIVQCKCNALGYLIPLKSKVSGYLTPLGRAVAGRHPRSPVCCCLADHSVPLGKGIEELAKFSFDQLCTLITALNFIKKWRNFLTPSQMRQQDRPFRRNGKRRRIESETVPEADQQCLSLPHQKTSKGRHLASSFFGTSGEEVVFRRSEQRKGESETVPEAGQQCLFTRRRRRAEFYSSRFLSYLFC